MTVYIYQHKKTGERVETPCTIASPYYDLIGTEDIPEPGGGGEGGTTNYNELVNKPKINNVELRGNKTSADLGIGSSLSEKIKASEKVGGVEEGKEYAKGAELETIFRDMLTPTKNPTLTDPKATLTYNVPARVPVGQTVSAATATVGLDRGSINPQYTAESAYRSGPATGYTISLSGASVSFSDSNATGNFSVPAFTRNTKGKVTVTATASYGVGVQPKNSAGGNYDSPLSAGSKTTTKEIEFVIPFYWGVTSDKDNIDFSTLTQDVTGKENKVYTYATVRQHPVFAYDADYNALSSIKDQNGFETISGWTKTVQDGKNVYVFNNATTDPSQKYTFTF